MVPGLLLSFNRQSDRLHRDLRQLSLVTLTRSGMRKLPIVIGKIRGLNACGRSSHAFFVAVCNRLKSGEDLPDPIWANFIWLCSRIV